MMSIKVRSNSFQTILFLLILVASFWLSIEAATCRTSGKLRAKMHPPRQCNHENNSECFKGKCSPPVSHHTKAILTVNNFEKGGGIGPSECDGKFHLDNTLIVALSTGWFNNKKRCFHHITIFAKGRRVKAKVVDECDSTKGCRNNIVDASPAVWKALGVPKERGELDIFWSDA